MKKNVGEKFPQLEVNIISAVKTKFPYKKIKQTHPFSVLGENNDDDSSLQGRYTWYMFYTCFIHNNKYHTSTLQCYTTVSDKS